MLPHAPAHQVLGGARFEYDLKKGFSLIANARIKQGIFYFTRKLPLLSTTDIFFYFTRKYKYYYDNHYLIFVKFYYTNENR